MKTSFVIRGLAGLAAVSLAGAAYAQDATEILGQPIQVTTNGVTNTIYLDQGGTARLITPKGNTLPATWQAAGGQLCLNNGAVSECWPYNSAFQPNQPQTLTSSCNATSTWLAQATNQPPSQGQKGERGR